MDARSALRASLAPTVLIAAFLATAPLADAGATETATGPVEYDTPYFVLDETRSFWADPVFSRTPIDIRFSNLDLVQAVRFLAGPETNVALFDASGTVSLDLQQMRPGRALDELLQQRNLGARFEDDVIFITSRDRRSYRLPFLKEADSWLDVESGIEAFLSPEGSVAIAKHSGVLTVEDEPARLDRIEDHLYRVLHSLQSQFEIEVKIIELVFDETEGAGLDWTLFNDILDSSWNVVGGTSNGSVGFSSTTSSRDVFQFGLLHPGRWQAFIDAFRDGVELDVISRPRITTLSNQPAQFEVREKIPYLTKTVSYDQGVAVTEFQLAFDEAGVKLELTASTSDDGMVILQVHPTVSSVVGFTGSLPDLGPQPIIDYRETESTVRLPEGFSLVMGGLMQDRENVTTLGIPVLSRIPGIGRIFRSEEVRIDKTEIVIAVTPRRRQGPAHRTLAALDHVRMHEVALGDESLLKELAASRVHSAWTRNLSGDHVAALSTAQAACRVAPAEWWTLNNLGIAQRDAGFLGLAEQSFRLAAKAVEPAPAVPLLNLGNLLVHQGRAAEAVRPLSRAVSPRARGEVRSEAALSLALAYELSGQPGEAFEVLKDLPVSGGLGPRVDARLERLRGALQ